MVLSQTRIICKSCGIERKFQDLVAVNNELICTSCNDRKNNNEPIETKSEESVKEYKQFVCNECDYKFKFNIKSKAVLRCPNCGKENVQENKFTGDKLIDESKDYDW
jgi:predicted Zn-ribbon and HTH transcriptional regulator